MIVLFFHADFLVEHVFVITTIDIFEWRLFIVILLLCFSFSVSFLLVLIVILHLIFIVIVL